MCSTVLGSSSVLIIVLECILVVALSVAFAIAARGGVVVAKDAEV